MQELETDEKELWELCVSEGDAGAKNKLVEKYIPYAMKIAKIQFSKRIEQEMEYHEYEQNAVVGLIEAIDKYNPRLNASFETFASYRIKGAIYNGIAKYSEKQQQVAYFVRKKREQLNSLQQENDTDADPLEQISELVVGLAIGYMLADSSTVSDKSAPYATDIYSSCEYQEIKELLNAIVEKLPEQEKTIIKRYYFQDYTFKKIAEEFQLTTSRVSQLHKSAILSIKKIYEKVGTTNDIY